MTRSLASNTNKKSKLLKKSNFTKKINAEEEVKAIYSYNFYPQHYLNEALSTDTKNLGVNGERIKDFKKEWLKKYETLVENNKDSQSIKQEKKEFIRAVFKALGFYDVQSMSKEGYEFEFSLHSKHYLLPVERRFDLKGNGELWILMHYSFTTESIHNEDNIFLDQPSQAYLKEGSGTLTYREVIQKIFDSDESGAEWIIISNAESLFLVERSKWETESEAYLECNLKELYELNSNSLFRVAEALFSPKAFPIDQSDFFHEQLSQNAHKKAAQVTKSLRDRVRESIELIANEVLEYHKHTPLSAWKNKKFDNPTDQKHCSKELMEQSIRYIYRILFMLFAESQATGKGSLPVHSSAYQLGYSIEKLRNLEGVPNLGTRIKKSSNFIQTTLERAAYIYFNGYHNNKVKRENKETKEQEIITDSLGFCFPSLGTYLFNSESTALINESVLSDAVMQKVICKLSQAQMGSGKGKRTYRVHYAGLGLNQLGAVYEGLLSLSPEILSERSIALVKEDKEHAPRIIPVSKQKQIDQKLIAKDEDGNPIYYEKGTFTLLPVGLDRKLSASFYTAEVLTRFVAKEAVDTLLEKDQSLSKMENLKILEPAMGSGAFLNAVVDELAPKMAKHYLDIDKKRELKDKNFKAHSIEFYKQKAKEHLMRHCVYGVDLNPVAVELAKISLWLNCLHEDGNLPFLDFKLRAGNSLVGAWIYKHRNKEFDVPHFLIPKAKALEPHLQGLVLGMKNWPFLENEKDKQKIKEIQNSYINITKDKASLEKIKKLSKKIDELYSKHLNLRKDYRDKVQTILDPNEKRKCFNEFVEKNTAYNQLRTMMDFWCALWFWPHDSINILPNAKDYLEALEWIANTPLTYNGKLQEQLKLSGNIALIKSNEIAKRNAFFHYDLEFAEVMSEGGFDLVLGNPPWATVRWEEVDFFEERIPGIGNLIGDSKKKTEIYKKTLDENKIWVKEYKNEASRIDGYVTYLKDSDTYPFKDSSQTNTYKFFYQRFYDVTKKNGIHSMIAQDGILSDEGNKEILPTYLNELVKIFRFVNYKKLFEDVAHLLVYMISISRRNKENISFNLIDNLYHPDTVNKCLIESKNVPYRGLKDDLGELELRGHPKRIVKITDKELSALARFNDSDNPYDSSLPIIHGSVELDLLINIVGFNSKIQSNLIEKNEFAYSPGFHGKEAPIKGLIKRNPGKTKKIQYSVLTGPNIFVGNPANKEPNPGCRNKGDFKNVDLDQIPDDYYPDTVYQLTESGLKSQEYLKKTPWGSVMSEEYRVIGRSMVSVTGARTLSSSIIFPRIAHHYTTFTICLNSKSDLIIISGLFNSLIYDFFYRSVCGGNIGLGVLSKSPWLNNAQLESPLIDLLMARALRLSAISNYYNDLWKKVFNKGFCSLDIKSGFMPKLPYSKLKGEWVRDTCIRNEKAREQALCEIDAIVAHLFDIDKQTLLDLYRSQFGVLQKNLQDLPNQIVDIEKYHFPRYQAMSDAYDQVALFIKQNLVKKAS